MDFDWLQPNVIIKLSGEASESFVYDANALKLSKLITCKCRWCSEISYVET